MRRMTMALLALLPLIAACVSVEEAPLGRTAVQKGQRTILLVYPAPAPYVGEDQTKGETAAELIPGLGLVVSDAQNQRDLEASKDLQPYVPRSFDAAAAFAPIAL